MGVQGRWTDAPGRAVDSRGGGHRVRGHAARADAARAALGLKPHFDTPADIPPPVVHAALGIAACALGVLVRPESLGVAPSVIAVTALAIGVGAAILIYDRLVYPIEIRPGPESVALPAASMIAFAVVLSATTSLPLRVAAGIVVALAIGAVPYLGGLRAVGRENTTMRLVRDALGVIVLAPALLAAASLDLETPVRLAAGGGATLLVTVDALCVEDLRRRFALIAAVILSATLSASALIAHGASPGLGAGLLLIVWYGLRGLAVASAAGRRGVTLSLEYLVVVVVGIVALGVIDG